MPTILDRSKMDTLLHTIRLLYPDWNGFDHPGFVKDEVEYKQRTIQKAHQILSEPELHRLFKEDRIDEFIRRLEAVGRDNNLLYQSRPRQGDLNILYLLEGRQRRLFCEAMIDLLYGPGDSSVRLGRYLDWVRHEGLPMKWTFPTYFLFICHPESEIFVKPGTTKAFLGLLGFDEEIRGEVTPEKYAFILHLASELRYALAEYGPRDMVDIQGFIYVCGRLTRKPLVEGIDNKRIPDDEDPDEFIDDSPKLEIQPDYPLAEVAAKAGLTLPTLERWVRAIERKGQAILYGPPGTGKTHMARELARHLIGGGDGFSELVQFHPSYSYEEFIQGIRPEPRPEGGLDYPLKKGRFLEFCDRTRERTGTCVLIIDEINRANLSRVFGELMYLLEYRDESVPLAAGGSFSIPKNVRILGTMNTADRSIALVDHALRRRFAFIDLKPNFEVLRSFHGEEDGLVDRLIVLLQTVNRGISNPHYEIGITFFLKEDLDQHLEDIWRMEIFPYLEEYFFDQPEKSESFHWDRVRSQLLHEE